MKAQTFSWFFLRTHCTLDAIAYPFTLVSCVTHPPIWVISGKDWSYKKVFVLGAFSAHEKKNMR